MHLLAGRLFTQDDGRNLGSRLVVVNEAFLAPYGLEPAFAVGMSIGTAGDTGMPDNPDNVDQIIGVVSDFYTRPDQPTPPQIFRPSDGAGTLISSGYLWVRASENPMALEARIRRIVTRDQTTRMADGETLADQMSASMASRRVERLLLVSFAVMALALALVGTYGVLNFTVTERTREIGVRMSLGATKAAVTGMVVGHGLRFAVLGVLIGIGGALALARVLESLLYGVSPTDPWTYGAVSVLMFAMALAASAVPAWRATRVDPIRALRDE
jgi:hypothetical protein